MADTVTLYADDEGRLFATAEAADAGDVASDFDELLFGALAFDSTGDNPETVQTMRDLSGRELLAKMYDDPAAARDAIDAFLLLP